MSRPLPTTFLLGFLLLLGLAVSGCTNQKLSSREADAKGEADATGDYALISVNGETVPASVSHDGVMLKVISGTFSIGVDGTCSSKTIFIPPSGAEIAREVSATYTESGSKLTMQWENAGTTVGTVHGDTFTMDNEGMVFVYRK